MSHLTGRSILLQSDQLSSSMVLESYLSVVAYVWCMCLGATSMLCPCLRFEAAKLVMNWLSSHEDQALQRMAVAVISILVAKVGP